MAVRHHTFSGWAAREPAAARPASRREERKRGYRTVCHHTLGSRACRSMSNSRHPVPAWRCEHAKTASHEAGLFQGRLSFEGAIVLVEEGCSAFSNIDGLTVIRFPRGRVPLSFGEVQRTLAREKLIRGDPASPRTSPLP